MQRGAKTTYLVGTKRVLARLAWLAAFGLVIVTFISALPAALSVLGTVCETNCSLGQLASSDAKWLSALGVPLRTYAGGYLVFTSGITVVWWLVALIIFWRKSDDWMGLLVSITLVAQGANSVTEPLYGYQLAPILLNSTAWVALMLAVYLFPDGRFVPRWTRWAALVLAMLTWLDALHQANPAFSPGPLLSPLLLWPAFLGTMIGAQVYRYLRVSNYIERQQTKWVVFGVGIFVIAPLLLQFAGLIFSDRGRPQSLYNLTVALAVPVLALSMPISIAFAILRSRLWDIDVIINRAVVYSVLTTALVATYFVSIAIAETLLQPFTGQARSQPALVVSTLAIAALFNPFRRRIQLFIDRRFYRRKYDATRTLAEFGEGLRAEIDLVELQGRLISVVEETVQPAHVSVWLRGSTTER